MNLKYPVCIYDIKRNDQKKKKKTCGLLFPFEGVYDNKRIIVLFRASSSEYISYVNMANCQLPIASN